MWGEPDIQVVEEQKKRRSPALRKSLSKSLINFSGFFIAIYPVWYILHVVKSSPGYTDLYIAIGAGVMGFLFWPYTKGQRVREFWKLVQGFIRSVIAGVIGTVFLGLAASYGLMFIAAANYLKALNPEAEKSIQVLTYLGIIGLFALGPFSLIIVRKVWRWAVDEDKGWKHQKREDKGEEGQKKAGSEEGHLD